MIDFKNGTTVYTVLKKVDNFQAYKHYISIKCRLLLGGSTIRFVHNVCC